MSSLAVIAAVAAAAAPCPDLEEARRAIDAAAKASPPGVDAELEQVERQVGFAIFADVSGAPAAKATAAAERLASYCALRRAPVAQINADAQLLRSIYARPEFAEARNRTEDMLAILRERVLDWFEALFATRGGKVFVESYRVLVLGAAFAVILFLVLHLRRAGIRRSRRAAGPQQEGAALQLDDPETHLQNARAALRSDPRSAIREALLGLLSSLERRRWARPDRVKTNRELAAELPERGAPAEVARQADALLHWYDRAFYSLAAIPPADAERFVADVEALHGQVVRGGEA